MAQTTGITATQNTFTSGELSPKLLFRTNTGEYVSGLEECTNAQCDLYGGVRRRSGSKYVAEVKTSANATRLIPFQFNQDTSYVLELGNLYIRFITNGGVVQSGGVPYEIASPYTTAQLDDIGYTQVGNTLYLVHGSVAPRKLEYTSATSWKLSTVDSVATYESGFAPSTTLTPAATSGTAVNFTAGSATWLQSDVGREIINLSSGETGRATITSITSTTVAVCNITTAFTDTSAIASQDWYISGSPVCDLEVDGIAEGSIVKVRSEYPSGSLGTSKTITGVTAASPAVVTSTSHGLSNGDRVVIKDVVGMTQINDRIFTISGVAANTFNLLGENSTGYTAYSSGGTARRLFTDIAVDAFRSADVGKYISINGGILKIISVDSASLLTCQVIKGLTSSTATGVWTLETATWTASRGYPATVTSSNQRLIYAGTTAEPQTVWMSAIGDLENFFIGTGDSDAISIDILSDQANQIRWVSGGNKDLLIGTSGGEFSVDISSGDPVVRPRSTIGSRSQKPINIKNDTIFVDKTRTNMVSLRYDFNIDGYNTENITKLSEHITEGLVKETAYSQQPNSTIYAVTVDGDLLTCTYDRATQTVAWSKFVTNGNYESVCSITESTEDKVYVIVKRTVNSNTKRYIEMFTSQDGTSDIDGFSDSYLSLSTPLTITGITKANPAVVTSASHGLSNGDKVILKGILDPEVYSLDPDATNMSSLNGKTFTVANVTTNTFQLSGKNTTSFNAYGSSGYAYKKVTAISGLSHLEGETVQIKVDGASHPDAVVSSGAITLDQAAGQVVVGLPYTTTIRTVEVPLNNLGGALHGLKTRWNRIILRVLNSYSPLVNNRYMPSRNTSDLMGVKVPLYTGYLDYRGMDWSESSSITIATSTQFPLFILGYNGIINTSVDR